LIIIAAAPNDEMDGDLCDIFTHMISLIPLADHKTASALACTCHGWRGFFAEFLRVNGMIRAESISAETPIWPCDHLHGTIRRMISNHEEHLLLYRQRGCMRCMECNEHAEYVKYIDWSDKTFTDMILHFAYGRLISYHEMDESQVYASIKVLDVVDSNGAEVTIRCSFIHNTTIDIELLDHSNHQIYWIYRIVRYEYRWHIRHDTSHKYALKGLVESVAAPYRLGRMCNCGLISD
jgi:hypothetical protein